MSVDWFLYSPSKHRDVMVGSIGFSGVQSFPAAPDVIAFIGVYPLGIRVDGLMGCIHIGGSTRDNIWPPLLSLKIQFQKLRNLSSANSLWENCCLGYPVQNTLSQQLARYGA